MVRCDAAGEWYGVVWYGMVWYGMVWYGMVWHGMIWYPKSPSWVNHPRWAQQILPQVLPERPAFQIESGDATIL